MNKKNTQRILACYCSSFGMHFGRHLIALHSRLVHSVKKQGEIKVDLRTEEGRKDEDVHYLNLGAAAFT